jgi:hypothetical protein
MDGDKGMKIATTFFSLLLLATNINSEEITPNTTKVVPIQSNDTRSIMVIEPTKRSEDIKSIVELLRKDKPTSKIFFKLSNGIINNVLEVQLMTNGTILLIKSSSLQGIKYNAILTEDILEIGHN